MKQIYLFFFLVFSIGVYSQNITIDDTYSAQQLVENVLFNNTGCATISNFNVSGGDFGTGENSFAYFSQNGSSFPFMEGVVLSTGKAIHAVGPNTTLSDDEGINWGTDSDLDAVFSNTLNATVLEFDFIPLTDFFSFDYIFASEEYQEGNPNTCQYSDVFAFLIKPIGGSYTNIALVPNTSIPVSVTSVHPEIPNGCNAQNEAYFGQWNDSTAPINYNGQTAILRAKGNVIPNQTYHIKLVIADHTNYRYDSAVFILANSFNIGIDLGIDRLVNTGNALCENDTLTLDAGIGNNYQWYKDNVLLSGETNRFLSVSLMLGDGTYSVERDNGFGCLSQGEITIEFDSIPIVNNTSLTDCVDSNDLFSTFNLFDAYNAMINGDTSLTIQAFYYNGVEIQNPSEYTNVEQEQYIQVQLVKPSGCFATADLVLYVYQNPRLQEDQTLYYCLDNFPDTIILNSGLVEGNPNTNITYLWSTGDISDSIMVNSIGDYTVEVTNSNGCSVMRTITVEPSTIAQISNILVTENRFYPITSVVIEVVGQGNYVYALDLETSEIDDIDAYQEENYFENVPYGEHIVYIKDLQACDVLIYPFITLQYPKFVTPNGDNRYDTWNIDNLNNLVHFNIIGDVLIFDRYGKVLATIKPNGIGWDAKYNGKKVVPDDYWFSVKMIDFKGEIITKKGHFSVK